MSKIQTIKPQLLILTKKGSFCSRKYNPKSLGWIRPNGVINFQNAEAAENYAKNRCVFALNIKEPFERGVLVKDNQILAEVDGDIDQVDMIKYADQLAGASFFHGHPRLKRTNADLPLSLKDYLLSLSHNVKKVVAFNENGEHSTLILKHQNNRFIKYLPKKFQQILIEAYKVRKGTFVTNEYGKLYASMFPKNLQKKAECMVHSHIGQHYGDIKKIDAFRKNTFNLSFEDCLEIESIMNYLKESGAFNKTMNNFWEKISKKINCIYETNFADLKKQ